MKSLRCKSSDRVATFCTLVFCISLSGCGDSSSGIPYRQLEAPKSPPFATWSPLPASETEGSEAKDSPLQTNDMAVPSQTANPDSDIQQVAAGNDDSKSSDITQAVGISPAPEDSSPDSEPADSEPPVLTPDMTPQERMNLLMNNPDLEESTEILEIKLLIPTKRFREEDDGQVTRVSYDDIDLLKVLNMQPVPADADTYFPEWLSGLDGKRIRIRGFMIPPFQATGLKRFALARDNGICCFVRTPKIYDVIDVRMADGETTDYIANKPFDVEGVFRIQPFADDGELYKLYKIEDAVVTQ